MTDDDAVSEKPPIACAHARTYKKEEKSVIICHPSSGHELVELANRIARLSPSHRDPERFHLDKSEIVADLRAIARRRAHG